MRALIIASGSDTGGQQIRWKRAFDRLMPDWRVRSAVMTIGRGNLYPYDIHWAKNRAAVKRLYADADVIHLNNTFHPVWTLDARASKPLLMHQHGSIFRSDPRRHLALAKRHRAVVAVSTIDLLKPAPESMAWLPTAYNLAELAELRMLHRRPDDGMVRIAHAPTNQEIKSTAALIAAVETLKSEGLPVELDIIEGQPWSACLARKAASDIYFDQALLGYGCNAVEAWGMGIPVIAGAQPWTLERMAQEFDGAMPFAQVQYHGAVSGKVTDADVAATAASIANTLRPLVTDADTRAEWAAKGAAHAHRFHAEAPALERLVALYQKAIARRAPKRARTSTRAA